MLWSFKEFDRSFVFENGLLQSGHSNRKQSLTRVIIKRELSV